MGFPARAGDQVSEPLTAFVLRYEREGESDFGSLMDLAEGRPGKEIQGLRYSMNPFLPGSAELASKDAGRSRTGPLADLDPISGKPIDLSYFLVSATLK